MRSWILGGNGKEVHHSSAVAQTRHVEGFESCSGSMSPHGRRAPLQKRQYLLPLTSASGTLKMVSSSPRAHPAISGEVSSFPMALGELLDEDPTAHPGL